MIRALLVFLLLGLLGSNSQLAFAKTITVSGNIPRDTSLDYFDVTITVTDISKTTPAAGEDLFKDRLRIWLTELSSSTSEYVPFEGGTPVTKVPFTVRLTSNIVQTGNSNNLTDFTYNVRIAANATGGLKDNLLTGGKTSTKLQVYYYEDKKPEPEVKAENITIAINTAIVKSAPIGVSANGTHRSITVKWSDASSATWSDGKSIAPSKLVAVAIDKSSSLADVPAYLYDSTSSTDADAAEGSCVYVSDSDTCIQCSDTEHHYLNPSKLGTLTGQGVFVATAEASANEVSISGLENDKPYAVFTFFTPGGLTRSACLTATPVENTTWSERNGEGDAKLSDPKCFIATAAYGSSLHRNLKPLRWFRDRVLLRSKIGAEFVDWYYQNGPSAAKVVANYPALQLAVQAVLWIPVLIISAWMTLSGEAAIPHQTIFVSACCALIVTLFIIRRSRRGSY